ncbi:hypothetical protein SERLADRAFT_365133 [Serpula lacrymans var. lacrymans S7.9]|uniref:F-box domain-containing protein n=1 Tax=Serpula lacrymans var. lacrymans (strain S7.9) TaxID=578457 RepID=F8NGM6_SERL9|nr:uncharacterized protein SERLADRAFT_365133 [Serpula lacrymans var. lacrymans S7.9]EGO29108.1 hypothetical protein SERLADRAFT_365133 [Serpula lacrymans var. lacrymans S7.9]
MQPKHSLLDFPEPPTRNTIAEARRELESRREQLAQLTDKIDAAEAALAQIVAESRCTIGEMQLERELLEEKVFHTMAYISPIRRLPNELLRQIFLFNFDDYPCCAWIRLITTQSSSADTIRLWLERSGDKVPLDIEIFLQVNGSSPEPSTRTRPVSPTPWPGGSFPHTGSPPAHYVISHTPGTAIILPPAHTPIIVPPSPSHPDWSPPPPSAMQISPQPQRSMHWGHIAIFYLVEQMPRWQRFVFRFDKQFSSMSALKSISGDAPVLSEFEISCAEPTYYTDWPWLPSASVNTQIALPKLESLTLQFTPFKWSSPIFKTNLRSLTLRALPASHLPLDRILHIVSSNPGLESLSLHFTIVLPAILPLSPTTLPELRELTFGGHYHMSQLVDSLILPSLDMLNLDIEAREPVEDTISNMLTRSNNPPLRHLSVAYGNTSSTSIYYGPGGVVISWTFLSELNHLQTLNVGGTPFEPLLTALGAPDEDQTQWSLPNLTALAMKNCHAHGDGVAKLVQMVESRNPDTGNAAIVNGVSPTRLTQLELYDCASLGQDVINWLKKRVEEVVCTEPSYVRSL